MQRPVGTGCNSGLSHKMADQALPSASACMPPLLKGRDGNRGRANDLERGDLTSKDWDGILSSIFLVPKKDGGHADQLST